MSATDLKNQGNAAVSAGKYQEAIDLYTQAIDLEPSNHVFYSNRSAAHMNMNNAQKALEDANKCISIKPDWVKGYSRKGAALHELGKYEDAEQAFNEGLKIDPNNTPCKDGLGNVLKATQRPGSGDPMGGMASMFKDIVAKVASNPSLRHHLDDSAFMEKLVSIEKNPNLLQTYMSDQRIMQVFATLLGVNTGGDGPFNQAPPPAPAPAPAPKKKEPPKVVYDSPEHEKAEKVKAEGNEHYKKKEFEKALECYAQAKALQPKNPSYLNNEAAVYLELKDYEKCESTCKDAIKLAREHRADFAIIAKLYVRLGNCYFKEKRLEESQKAYEDAQMEFFDRKIDLKIKDVKKAIKKAEREAYQDPEEAVKAKERGNEKFKAGDFPGAVHEYTDAIARDPKSPVYYANRAAAYTKLMQFPDAKADCETALNIDPKYVKAISRKGAIEFFMKEYHKALETYQAGLEIDPEHEECKQGLQRTANKIQELNNSGEVDPDRQAKAMADPEIQGILRDPVVQTVLQEIQQNPRSAQKHLSNPSIAAKINKLVAAGVLQMR
jgi:stress-induced-phosphoprotein 1